MSYFGRIIPFFHSKALKFGIYFLYLFQNILKLKIMANKRDLKKIINYICDDLFSECVALSLYCGNKKKEELSSILISIAIIRQNYVRRVSHPEPGMTAKAYFNDLKTKLNEQITEITDNIANI